MASGLGIKKSDPKDVIKRRGGASHRAKAGETFRVVGGDGNSSYQQYQNQNWNAMPGDRLDFGALAKYKWNDRLKQYDAIPGHGKGYLKIEAVPMTAAPSGGGKGGGKGSSKKKVPGTDGNVYYSEPAQGVGTPEIMGDTYNNMMDWRPVSRNQGMNPLVDPNAWLHQVNPQHTVPRPVGTYIENDLLQNNKGLLV